MRITDYLATHGPVTDSTGRATAALMESIDYQGTPVAFIQLVAAMDKDGELERQIRGKRTYGIRLAETNASHASASPRGAAPNRTTEITTAGIDYEQLARTLLRELARDVTAAPGGQEIAQLTAQLEQTTAERDEYARRFEFARRQLAALISAGPVDDQQWEGVLGQRGRELLSELVPPPSSGRVEEAV